MFLTVLNSITSPHNTRNCALSQSQSVYILPQFAVCLGCDFALMFVIG